MSTPKIQATSGILYVRAALRPFVKQIKSEGGVAEFLLQHFEFSELFVPYFRRARPFWEEPLDLSVEDTNSGALGKQVATYGEAVCSNHPSHRFLGWGDNVAKALEKHDFTTSCFQPIKRLAENVDFSMLLLGCCDSSPGFSTVHATQFSLGLSQKHLFRFLVRWDVQVDGRVKSVIPNESPGCSESFDKFYAAYQADDNLIRGQIMGEDFLFVKSAARAIQTETEILRRTPRFVRCDKTFCSTCSLRLY